MRAMRPVWWYGSLGRGEGDVGAERLVTDAAQRATVSSRSESLFPTQHAPEYISAVWLVLKIPFFEFELLASCKV